MNVHLLPVLVLECRTTDELIFIDSLPVQDLIDLQILRSAQNELG